MVEQVKVQLVVVAHRAKRKRKMYTAEQKALALRVLQKADNSPAQAARRLLLWYPELFPDMTQSSGGKNLRQWRKEATASTFNTDQEQGARRRSLRGRKPVLSEACLQAIYRMVLQQVIKECCSNFSSLTCPLKVAHRHHDLLILYYVRQK